MSKQHILACVTVQKACEKMIVEGAKLAREIDGKLIVLHVSPSGEDMLGYPAIGEALEYLYRISSLHDAEMSVIRATDVVDAIVKFAKKRHVSVILTGASNKESGRNIALELTNQLPGMIFQTIYSEE